MVTDDPTDSVDRELAAWTGPMLDVDPAVEAARQRIGRLARLFALSLEDLAREEGLSLGDWEALSVIVRAGRRCTPTALAQALRLTSGTVSTRLNRLTEAGLVAVVADADGRSRPVTVTDEGFARWQRATARRTRFERGMFDQLGAGELAALNDLLRPVLNRYERELGETSRHDLRGTGPRD